MCKHHVKYLLCIISFHLLTHLTNIIEHSLVPGIALGSGDVAGNKTNKTLHLTEMDM